MYTDWTITHITEMLLIINERDLNLVDEYQVN